MLRFAKQKQQQRQQQQQQQQQRQQQPSSSIGIGIGGAGEARRLSLAESSDGIDIDADADADSDAAHSNVAVAFPAVGSIGDTTTTGQRSTRSSFNRAPNSDSNFGSSTAAAGKHVIVGCEQQRKKKMQAVAQAGQQHAHAHAPRGQLQEGGCLSPGLALGSGVAAVAGCAP
jgi:hypothetical protein